MTTKKTVTIPKGAPDDISVLTDGSYGVYSEDGGGSSSNVSNAPTEKVLLDRALNDITTWTSHVMVNSRNTNAELEKICVVLRPTYPD